MPPCTTLVVDIFDLQRIPKDNLLINCPMIIFTFEALKDEILRLRRDFTTYIIIKNLLELDLDITAIKKLTSDYGKYAYDISRYHFLKEATDLNPFESEYFFLVNLENSRPDSIWPRNSRPDTIWPNHYKIKVIANLFVVNDVLLGGKAAVINKIHDKFYKQVTKNLKYKLLQSSEEILSTIIKKRPCKFYHSKHELLKIFSQSVFMPLKYPIEPRLKLFALATKEITDRKIDRWRKSAYYFGFDYEVLGRNDKWQGFGMKIKLFHQAIKRLEDFNEVVVLTDSTDVFFVGSAMELYDKFIAENKKLIVGGESNMWYLDGRNDKHVIKDHFVKIAKSPQCFPNSGFIMGFRDEILQLLELHLEYKDDQGPCFDTIYENKLPLDIDYDTNLVANIPPHFLGMFGRKIYLKWSEDSARYKNILNDNAPIVLHFAGKNFEAMKNYYNNFFPSDSVYYSDSNNDFHSTYINITNTQAFIILIIIALILIIVMAWINHYFYRR